MASEQTSWGIVGGGILGMELGRQLAAAGDQVTVFEAAAEPGGLAMTWDIAGTRWDKHYHVIAPTDDRLVKLVEELGLGDDLVWNKSSTGLYAGETLYSVSSTAEFLRLPSLRLVDKFRLGITTLYASRVNNWQRLEKISAEKWLSRWSGRRTYREFWRPLLRSKLGDNADKASAAFIWAILKRLYKARTSGAKTEKFGFGKNGYGPILDAMVEAITNAGVDLVTEARVSSVVSSPNGGTTVTLSGGEQHDFDKVVVTTTAPVIADIVKGLTAAERKKLEGIIYQGIVCVSLVLDRPLGGFYVTNITDDGFPFTGVIEMTALVDPATFNGKNLVYLPRYTTQDDEAWGWSDDEVVKRFIESLRRMYPDLSDDDIVEAKVSRVKNVLAVSVINHSESIPPVWTSVPNVAIVSSAQILHGTLNVDETLGMIESAMPELRSGKPLHTNTKEMTNGQ
ncbi:MAG: NAD(P)/FAD-dependent oxidoreductase [Acidimicrobiia bacterium]|nr:NAD(P)/FAD-dependent oxidoreductase [Acidimicrobiia bacterium]MDX2468038.1 NAD(P)/FAD-dependent oxidoreductase [Acidimicrobiia bacterium]